ncbi:MAG: hypothetical protein U1F57_07840 [bacterium]
MADIKPVGDSLVQTFQNSQLQHFTKEATFKSMNSPGFQEASWKFSEKLPEFKAFFDKIDIKTITVTTSPFVARLVGSIQGLLSRVGLAGLSQSAGMLAAPVSSLSLAEAAGPVGAAALAGVGTGIALNYFLPQAGGALGDFLFDSLGPASSDSWIWKLDGSFIRAFDSNKTVGDTIAKGIHAAVGSPSGTTIDVLDHMGFGGWNAFVNSWGF